MRTRNLLGQLHRHYDEAGLTAVATEDFKGNVLDKSRRVIADASSAVTPSTNQVANHVELAAGAERDAIAHGSSARTGGRRQVTNA